MATRKENFRMVNTLIANNPICVVISIDESEVGGRGLSQNMDKTRVTGYTTGTHQHPTCPNATFSGNHTSLLTGVAVKLESIMSDNLLPGEVVPSLYVFSGKESVPVPENSSDFVPKSTVACTESGAVTNQLFEKHLEFTLLPDLQASYPLKKGVFEVLVCFDRPRTHSISARLIKKFIDAGVLIKESKNHIIITLIALITLFMYIYI